MFIHKLYNLLIVDMNNIRIFIFYVNYVTICLYCSNFSNLDNKGHPKH